MKPEQNKPSPNEGRSQETDKPVNPFENGQSADQDLKAAAEELENEQQFKEALTERD